MWKFNFKLRKFFNFYFKKIFNKFYLNKSANTINKTRWGDP